MSLSISERFLSRDGTAGPTPEGIRRYVITGTDSETLAQTLGASYAPATWGNLYRGEMRYTHQGGGVWHVEAAYGPRNRQPGQSEWSFSIGVTQIHTKHSLETVSQNVATGEPIDFAQAINVAGPEGERMIEGVDIPSADFTFQETLYLPAPQFTQAYFNTLYRTVAKTNQNPFRIFAAEELLLQGVSGRPAGDTVALTFQFAGSETEENISIGDIEGITKAGWHYLWVYYEEDGKDLVAKQVNVERVIETADFANLLIPDPFH